MSVIFTTITKDEEIWQLLDLQQKNLTRNISENVANDQGFVTVVHNFKLLSRMNEAYPQIIAKDGDQVVGYALVMPESFRNDIPVLTAMFTMLDELEYKGKLVKDYRYYAMGQICVAEGYRGQGLFDGLYAKHKTELSDKFELCVTEIAKRNTRSLAAHKRVGFEIIHEYFDTTYPELWEVVVLDLRG
ncbi:MULTISPECIES: GNAT family N-acetyltransferase [unclassified Arcicella]|uniref:GNAT family N-acetyltransferase n=1 Tax=unclassified Arcicella TaxID=2644986 RepID=UPI00285864C3|nr:MULTISPECIES: GNAT family N-acetyltransferase [unclassified Arcicella]MDR6561033.1 ribosomal protein S18 acetylase RimI-like enzyme [Arcicella sp. BE51]MDR6810917.1 ribosomal protein S18 acetylase RimI-like enzyme [Arcicella sp. BE140]MDR6822267.1 ribosomal protein S18 acetylase RimI-like enzyme [Arcicella sp. BE139]